MRLEVIDTKKVCLSEKLYRNLPPSVAQEVRRLAEDYRMGRRQVTVSVYPEGYQVCPGEGDRLVLIRGGEMAEVELVHSDTVGATGVSYNIGAKTPHLSVGTWFVRVYYYTRYWMEIGNIVPLPLTEGGNK